MADARKTASNEQVFEIPDLSGGMQVASTEFGKKANEVDYAENTDFGEVGAVGKGQGYLKTGNDLTSTSSTSTSTSTTTTSTSTSSSTSTSTSTTTTA